MGNSSWKVHEYCPAEKAAYDKCFDNFYENNFRKGNVYNPCKDLWVDFERCVRVREVTQDPVTHIDGQMAASRSQLFSRSEYRPALRRKSGWKNPKRKQQAVHMMRKQAALL